MPDSKERIMTRITFLGLGAMGSRMAARLIDAGHHVTLWNRTPERADALAGLGASVAQSPRMAACKAQIVISMLRDDAASENVWNNPETGAFRGMQKGALGIEWPRRPRWALRRCCSWSRWGRWCWASLWGGRGCWRWCWALPGCCRRPTARRRFWPGSR
ncbi:MAG TPA: NAD(P)-dependent oxidoreductase [Aliiroseovarius sp.]|nr:NAD(P)-dependent oxidoreductase [Aliiroseovarius sp.]